MNCIVIIAHAEIAQNYLACVEHILGHRPKNLRVFAVNKSEEPAVILSTSQIFMANLLLEYKGVLIITDLFGATPSNIATKLIQPGRIELLSGLNMPMLLRALSYGNESLAVCKQAAFFGGVNGIIKDFIDVEFSK